MNRPLIQVNDIVRPMNDDEYAEWLAEQPQRDAEQAATVRSERNKRLADCDWTQLPDSPLNPEGKAAWAFYRENLRMVPDQPGFPWNVQWPPQPS